MSRLRATRASGLLLRSARNDVVRNPGVNIALAVLLVLSAFLMGTGAMVVERLVASIDQLFAEAKPPHFLQMHAGEYDPAALDEFAASQPGIESWTVVHTIGFGGTALGWERPGAAGDLSDSLVENLFVSQNADFDLLLDESGSAAQPSAGEVYVPVAVQQRAGLETGDRLAVATDAGPQQFTVAGFVRDAQMASSLSSATRFLVSAADRERLEQAGGGTAEIIVEYRLRDADGAAALQQAYEADQALPKNGQAVTYDMIRMINAFSDGLVAVALVFASVLLILIAMLNLRLVIRGTLQDEVREIGAMKAIGLPTRDVRSLYLAKYALMAGIVCAVGGVLALAATSLLTRGIQTSYASAPVTALTVVVPVLALAAVFAVVMLICNGIFRRLRRIQVVNALVHGSTLTDDEAARAARRAARRVGRTSLADGRGSIGWRLALLDLRAAASQWVLIPVVFFLASILMVLPANLLATFQSPSFVTYMGAPQSDLRADIRFVDDIAAQRAALIAAVHADPDVASVREYAEAQAQVVGPEGVESLRVEVGDYSGETVQFAQGTAPHDGQIALSILNAEGLDAAVGDVVRLTIDGAARELAVSGIYQDVTSGGRTAKVQGPLPEHPVGVVVYADVRDGADPAVVAAALRAAAPEATVIPMADYVAQTLSYVTEAFRSAAAITFGFGLAVALLITVLFLRLRLSRDRQRLGVLSALGFSVRELAAQVRWTTIGTAAVGVAAGVAVAATLGGRLIGGAISLAGLGIADLALVPNPWQSFLAYPLVLVAAAALGAAILTAGLRRADKSTWLRG